MFAALEETDAVIYPIGLGPRVDRALLERLAAESGGLAYFPEDVSSLRDDYARVVEGLRRRYVVSYTSTNSTRDGGWRAVQIRHPSARDEQSGAGAAIPRRSNRTMNDKWTRQRRVDDFPDDRNIDGRRHHPVWRAGGRRRSGECAGR